MEDLIQSGLRSPLQAKSKALGQQDMEIVVHAFHITVGVVFVDVIATNAMLCI